MSDIYQHYSILSGYLDLRFSSKTLKSPWSFKQTFDLNYCIISSVVNYPNRSLVIFLTTLSILSNSILTPIRFSWSFRLSLFCPASLALHYINHPSDFKQNLIY